MLYQLSYGIMLLISQTRVQRYVLNAVYQIVFPHFLNQPQNKLSITQLIVKYSILISKKNHFHYW